MPLKTQSAPGGCYKKQSSINSAFSLHFSFNFLKQGSRRLSGNSNMEQAIGNGQYPKIEVFITVLLII